MGGEDDADMGIDNQNARGKKVDMGGKLNFVRSSGYQFNGEFMLWSKKHSRSS